MSIPMDRNARYSHVAIAFHWTIAVLVIANLAIGLLHESLLSGLAGAMGLHKSIGLTVLVLTAGRVVWRLAHRPPPLPAALSAIERGIAHLTHWVLYALLIVMPVTGWMMVSGAQRRGLDWFGLFDVPYLPIAPNLSGVGHEAHEVLGWLMLALVGLHVAAALRHHFILRDGVLSRMMPARRQP
ncbi:cytochrome b [Sphingomonas sp. Leaf17]|uniref:cytochrome b n=1 Tax=Sphingomonas sp. Leaf17 TaxID=1735683 RepID=UPI000ACDE17C|nr:cytochrome b [Sphingomonas sp. Leaf17]